MRSEREHTHLGVGLQRTVPQLLASGSILFCPSRKHIRLGLAQLGSGEVLAHLDSGRVHVGFHHLAQLAIAGVFTQQVLHTVSVGVKCGKVLVSIHPVDKRVSLVGVHDAKQQQANSINHPTTTKEAWCAGYIVTNVPIGTRLLKSEK